MSHDTVPVCEEVKCKIHKATHYFCTMTWILATENKKVFQYTILRHAINSSDYIAMNNSMIRQ
jgi:hypothetical protein